MAYYSMGDTADKILEDIIKGTNTDYLIPSGRNLSGMARFSP